MSLRRECCLGGRRSDPLVRSDFRLKGSCELCRSALTSVGWSPSRDTAEKVGG